MSSVVVEMSSDEAKLFRGLQKIIGQTKGMEGGFDKAKKSGRSAGDEIKGAFDPKNLVRYALSFLGVQKAIQVTISLLREMSQVRKESAQQTLQAEFGEAELAQLALGDPKKLRSLLQFSRGLFAAGGARDREEAARTIFALESAGIVDQRHIFQNLFGIVGAPDVLARAAATVQTALGKDETGNVRDIISKGFGASQFAPATVEQLLEATSRGAGAAKLLQLSDEELLAATTVTAKAAGSAELGGTQVSSLLTSLAKQEGFKGLSLQDSIAKVEGLGLSDPDLIKFLGRKEALRGFSVLRDNKEFLNQVLAAIEQSQEGDLIRDIISAQRQQPALAAALIKRRAESELEVARIPEGVEELLSQAVSARDRLDALEVDSAFFRAAGSKAQSFGEFLGPGVNVGVVGTEFEQRRFDRITQAAETGEVLSSPLGVRDDQFVRMEEAAKRTADAMERNTQGGPAQMPPDVDR